MIELSPARGLDPLVSLPEASTAIMAQFPEVNVGALRYLASGWQYDAFLTSDGWLFRFPRHAWCSDLFDFERRVHQLVTPALAPTVAVPKVELMGGPSDVFRYRFAGHRFIPGIPADAVEASLEGKLGREIGRALKLLHSIPESEARSAGITEPDLEEEGRRQWLECGLDRARGLRGLDPVIEPALSWIDKRSLPLPRYEGPLRFIHHDLSPEHSSPTRRRERLAGILDWTDAALGDPARDFVTLVTSRGWGFAAEVVRSYSLPTGSGFSERLQFLARLLSVIWLGEAHHTGAGVPKHMAWVRNAFEPAVGRADGGQ